MKPDPFHFLDYPGSELVIGIVAPSGTDTRRIVDILRDRIKRCGYTTEVLKLSEYLEKLAPKGTIDTSSPFNRLWSLMEAGDAFREKIKRGDALSLMAVSQIFLGRNVDQGSKCEEKPRISRPKTAYILNSLKHPDEVVALRRIYGDGFVLLGAFTSAEKRLRNLIEIRGIPKEQSIQLIKRDEDENRPSGLGQKTRDAFHLADAFVDANNCEKLEAQLQRIIDIFFGDFHKTPVLDEYAMFVAFATSFRSGDLSRQVGAVVVSENGEIVSVGCNDVPKYGGGLYTSDCDPDHRDYRMGKDSNIERKNEIYDRIVSLVKEKLTNERNGDSTMINESVLRKEVVDYFKGTTLANITEFGRTVHAEMEAIVSCARKGISVQKGTLYTTTFPCHNCARHIIAAGIHRVVYVEPYPKSQAGILHEDAIDLEGNSENKVVFEPFVGIGSRRFMDLFSMGLSSGYRIERKDDGTGSILNWSPEEGKLRVPLLPTTYIEREELAVIEFETLMEENDETDEKQGD